MEAAANGDQIEDSKEEKEQLGMAMDVGTKSESSLDIRRIFLDLALIEEDFNEDDS